MSRILPDFSLIAFVSSEEKAKPTAPGERTDLFKLFNAVLKCERLEVDERQLKEIISQDLIINTNGIDKRLLGVLKEALIYYMTVWPGWQRSDEYYKGKFPCEEWFGRFRQYLILKSNFIIKNAEKFAAELNNEKAMRTPNKDAAVQTQVSDGDKKIAPYTLRVGGPPYVLNNILFEESNGDVLIRQQVGKPWCNLKLKEFLNWPYVKVEVRLPDISLKRSNTHQFERYITFGDVPTVLPETNHITHMEKTNEATEHNLKPYSHDYIACYLQHFYRTLKYISGINNDRLQELKAIFSEFLKDIKEANVYNCTMCTYITIGYNIGKCKYVRRNRIDKISVEENTIDYYEILTPHVDFTLNNFNAVQDPHDTTKVAFLSIKRLLNNSPSNIENLKFFINNTCIVYICTICSKNFSGPHAYFNLSKHFNDDHKAERAVQCCKCRKEFDMNVLAENRWTHTCI